jgi:hypothetical protein
MLTAALTFGMTFTVCETVDNQVNEDDNTDTGVPPTVAADPGDTADIERLFPSCNGNAYRGRREYRGARHKRGWLAHVFRRL